MTHRDAKMFLPVLLLLIPLSGCGKAGDAGVVRLSGRIEASTVDLAPKVAGRVRRVLVREGDRVAADALLVELDLGETGLSVERDTRGVDSAQAHLRDLEAGSREPEISAARAQVADREAALQLAETELGRQSTLLDRKVGSRNEYDKAATSVERARASLAAAREQLSLLEQGFREWQKEQARIDVERARVVLEQSRSVAGEGEIRAPADAIVLHRIAEPGLLLAPGQPALTLGFAERLYVRVFIPETALGRVRQGSSATISVDSYPDRTFRGKVTEISPDAEFTPKPVDTKRERVNLVYAAKVDLDEGWDSGLVPGQPADVVVGAATAGTP